MKIYVNGQWYDPKDGLVIVKLEDQDKKNISNMLLEAKYYCLYPDNITPLNINVEINIALEK